MKNVEEKEKERNHGKEAKAWTPVLRNIIESAKKERIRKVMKSNTEVTRTMSGSFQNENCQICCFRKVDMLLLFVVSCLVLVLQLGSRVVCESRRVVEKNLLSLLASH